MGLLLAADDIAAGDHVTVHSAVPRMVRTLQGRRHALPVCPHAMPVPPGIPLRVLEVSLPFVACSLIEPGGTESGPAILDLRNVRLCRLNNSFVEAIKSFPVDTAGSEACDGLPEEFSREA